MAVMDWHSRKVLSWRLSNTLDAEFCVAALQEAITCHGTLRSSTQTRGLNSQPSFYLGPGSPRHRREHGWPRTSTGQYLHRAAVVDAQVPVLYLRSFDSALQLRQGLREWFIFYNSQRPHQTLDGMTPDEVYYSQPTLAEAA